VGGPDRYQYNGIMISVDLAGHTALVTGAGVRLGRAFALGLAGAGAGVVVHYHRSAEAAEATAHEARQAGAQAAVLQADLATMDSFDGLLAAAQEALGPVDLLVNNAAVFGRAGAAETTPEIWQRHIDLDLRAPVFLTNALASSLDDAPGAVVNLLDWRAFRPGKHHFAYTIAKSGLAAATRSLARAYAPTLRVNGLALGAILPPAEGDVDESLIRHVPLGRWGSVQEAVDSLLFLLGGPGYITGEILHLDGGRHLV
jgi:NAD(P)-dependent dehydrogenase (short-subunit alcohol dehydrogenase family)